MRSYSSALGIVLIAALAGCMSHDPNGVPHASREDSNRVGTTQGVAEGTVSGSDARTTAPQKDERGNTPPGVDRDGHGPAAGAIVDPTGAATRGRPY